MKPENIAMAKGTNLVISTKHAIEVCDFIRGKSVAKMQKYLADVLEFKKAIPYKRYIMDLPHQKGKQGPARYPSNAVTEILGILNSAVSNAEDKGLDTSSLVIKNATANKGPTVWRSGRKARRQAKRTHIEIILKETLETKKKTVPKTEVKVTEKPKEAPKIEKKVEENLKEAPKIEKKVEEKLKEVPKIEKKVEEKPKEVPKIEKKEEAPKKPEEKKVEEKPKEEKK